jgi:hypothetical protein
MEKTYYKFLSFITILFFSSGILFSQTWVRKVDGFSMWSIGKDYAGNIYAGTTGTARGIFKSTDGGETWNNVFSTGASNYLGIDCDSLNNVYVANATNGLIYSTDGGQNFTLIPSSVFNGNTINMVACGRLGHIFAGATNGGIWRSTDFGATWTNTALTTFTIVTIAVNKNDPDIIYAGSSSTSANGFFISTDGGLTFGPSTNNINIWAILQTSNGLIYTAATSSPYPFDRSTDGGLTWTTMSNQTGAMRGATLDLLDDIYTAGNGGVFKSTNGGVSFSNHNLTFSSNKILTYSNKIMVCVTGATNGGVWIFTDEAIPVELISFTASVNLNAVRLNWTTATETNNQGFEIHKKKSEVRSQESEWYVIGFVDGSGTTTETQVYNFADSDVKPGKYFYRLKQVDFDGTFEYSQEIEVEITAPNEFALFQNYPNPFNPSTKISWQLPAGSWQILKIYDVLGNEVATLVDEFKPAGRYEVEWNAGGLASGVYLYRLNAGSFTETKKMILLR